MLTLFSNLCHFQVFGLLSSSMKINFSGRLGRSKRNTFEGGYTSVLPFSVHILTNWSPLLMSRKILAFGEKRTHETLYFRGSVSSFNAFFSTSLTRTFSCSLRLPGSYPTTHKAVPFFGCFVFGFHIRGGLYHPLQSFIYPGVTGSICSNFTKP